MATTSQAMQSLLDSPAMAAPPGLEHNFINPPNLRTEFYVDVTICFIVSVVAVGIHMWTKVRLIRKVNIEDCKNLSPASLVFFLNKALTEYKTSVSWHLYVIIDPHP